MHFTHLTFFCMSPYCNFALRNQDTMYKQHSITKPFLTVTNFIATPAVKQFLKPVLYLGSLLSLCVYAWVRLLFHELPFDLFEETALILRILFAGWVLAACCIGGFNGLVFILEKPATVYHSIARVKWQLVKSLALLMMVSVLFACSGVSVSIKKDLNTGMITTGRGIQAAAARMVMNEETLNDAFIPLGESFFIVNEGISGLTVKDDKVSVGCSLQITDKKGNVLLSEADLFKGNDVFDKDKAGYFRCIVNTGKPMQRNEKYNISVVFTDKYGKGSVDNKVTIKMTDAP